MTSATRAGNQLPAAPADEQLQERLAQQLLEAWQQKSPIPPVRGQLSTIDEAYAVQNRLNAARSEQGARIVGAKIGLTAAAVQRQFGVYQPDFGHLLDDMVFTHGQTLSGSDFIQPKVEGEIAFILGADIDQERPTIADVLRAIDFVLPAIEIVDSRIAGWDIGILDTVADNASCGAVILGATPYPIQGVDLAAVGMVLEYDDEPLSFGSGSACLGSPAASVTWLAQELAQRGQPLRAGQIIMSGALGPMIPVHRNGGRLRLSLEGLSPSGPAVVEARLSAMENPGSYREMKNKIARSENDDQ